jgi:hypothetical protein
MFWGIRWFTYVPYPKHFSTVACKYQISGIFYFRCVESGELLFALHGIKSDAMGCDEFSKKNYINTFTSNFSIHLTLD